VIHLLEVFGGPRLHNGDELLGPMRAIKTPEELAAMERACRLVDHAMAAVSDHVRAGVTELELAEEVDHQLLTNGSRTASLDTRVWSMGPHDDRVATVRVSSQPLREGSGVSFDFGSVVEGYCSDLGRTIFIGEPDEQFRRAYELVIAGQAAGIAAVRPGVTAAEVHRATRAVIVEGGYGDWFRHRPGHCIGMDVHEKPFVSEEDQTPLQAGMTFTIEPSIFWPAHVGAHRGHRGVRAGRRPQAQPLPGGPGRQRLTSAGRLREGDGPKLRQRPEVVRDHPDVGHQAAGDGEDVGDAGLDDPPRRRHGAQWRVQRADVPPAQAEPDHHPVRRHDPVDQLDPKALVGGLQGTGALDQVGDGQGGSVDRHRVGVHLAKGGLRGRAVTDGLEPQPQQKVEVQGHTSSLPPPPALSSTRSGASPAVAGS
jgi:Metallopeptidase family M24